MSEPMNASQPFTAVSIALTLALRGIWTSDDKPPAPSALQSPSGVLRRLRGQGDHTVIDLLAQIGDDACFVFEESLGDNAALA